MISIEQLQQTLSSTNFKQIKLPYGQYTQKTYTELKGNKRMYEEELQQQEEIMKSVETGIEVNIINSQNINGFDDLIKQDDKKNYRIAQVKYSSYINYTENSTFEPPEDLINLLGEQYCCANVKLYGLKNPNSFLKSIILLNEPNYMVFNKYQMNQAVFKWQTDLAFYYKNSKEQFVKLARNDLRGIETNLLKENYYNYAMAQIASSYTNKNLLVIDYINNNYEIYLSEMKNHNTDNIIYDITKNNLDFHIIIKYRDCFLPCLKINTQHLYKFISELNKLEFSNSHYYSISNINDIDALQNNTNNFDNDYDNEINIIVGNGEEATYEVNNGKTMLYKVVDMKKLKRDDMQRIAIAYGIDVLKTGVKPGSFIKKTKQELFNDFKMVEYDPVKLDKKDF